MNQTLAQGAPPGRPAGGQRVVFQAADGLELQGTVLRLSRHATAFELHPGAAALRTSEALGGFKIFTGDEMVYFGRAVVSGIVQAGTTAVVEVKLGNAESESAFFQPADRAAAAHRNFGRFFENWQKEYRIAPEFKVLVVDIAAFLTGVRQWLEHASFGLDEKNGAHRAAQENELLAETAQRVISGFNVQHERFEELAYAIPRELLGAHQEFVRRHWHRLFLCSPFGHRTYFKPLGYAGDYEMMDMIHRNRPEGRTLFEKLIHQLLVSQWPAQSVRNRIAHLEKNLATETARVVRGGRRARILNVGCGPAREVQSFLAESELSHEADITLLDFNQETLQHAGGEIDRVKRRLSRRTKVAAQNISVNQLLRRAVRRDADALGGKYDYIYCAGLFDYLSDHTCTELVGLFHENLLPGGLVAVANMDDSRPFRNFIEFVLDWQLIYRDAEEMARFAPGQARHLARVISEPPSAATVRDAAPDKDFSLNLFLHLRKPD